MSERYVVAEWDGVWWVIDTTLADDHPQKIISSHSQKEAAEDTAAYQNTLNDAG